MLNSIDQSKILLHHVDRRGKEILPENYTLEFIPHHQQPTTGCWRWDVGAKAHVIQLNEACDRHADRLIDSLGLSEGVVTHFRSLGAAGTKYATLTKIHEDAHSLITDPDFEKVIAFMKARTDKLDIPECPFSILNLFEDARIEAWERRERKFRFGWLKYEFSYLERTARTITKTIPAGSLKMVPVEDGEGVVINWAFEVSEEDEIVEQPAAMPVAKASAPDLFMALIQAENQRATVKELRDACRAAAVIADDSRDAPYRAKTRGGRGRRSRTVWCNGAAMIEAIIRFYNAATKAADTMAVAKLCVDFWKIFHDDRGDGDGAGDRPRGSAADGEPGDWESAVRIAIENGLATTGDPEEKGGERSTVTSGRATPGKASGEHSTKETITPTNITPDPSIHDELKALVTSDYDDDRTPVSADTRNPHFDWKRVLRVLPSLQRALLGGEKTVRSMSPKRRVDFRAIVKKSPRIFRGKGTSPVGRKKILFMFDASGSMTGTAFQEGLVLLGAINELHRKGVISAEVILNYGPFLKVPMPFNPAMLFHLEPVGGCEGLKFALESNDASVRAADLVLCYTDACITDFPIDLSYWRVRGIESIGLYCGAEVTREGEKPADQLKKYFTKSLVRRDMDTLIASMVRLIKHW